MKNRLLVRFVFGALLALLPAFVSGVPWDPNRARPTGFQHTLGYLANDLYDYPQANLRKQRNTLLTDDIVTTVIEKLKAQGYPPSSWEALGQQGVDGYKAQYEQAKTTLRQTKTDPEGILRAIEGNQPLSAELLEDPLIQALILEKWVILTIAENTYQSLLYEHLIPGGPTGGGSPPSPPTDISPPKPGKGKPGVDLKRMQEARLRAIARRRAFEERAAREAAAQESDLERLLKWLLSQAQSSNKFQARPAGGYLAPPPSAATAEPVATAATTATATTEPPPSIEEIEKIEDEITEAEKKEDPPAEKPTDKVTVYRGTLILRRPPGWSDDTWQTIKKAFTEALAKPPGTTDMNDKGDEVTWRYKLLQPGGYPLKASYLQDIPDAETTEEGAPGDSKPAKPAPKFEGNGPLPSDAQDVDVPGTEQKPVETKPAPTPRPTPTKFAPKDDSPKPTIAMHDGYWFDPTDESRDADDPFIYVRANGVAHRIELSKAPAAYGIPEGLTIDQMSWYDESQHRLVKNYNNTHRSSGAQSSNKFAKPKS